MELTSLDVGKETAGAKASEAKLADIDDEPEAEPSGSSPSATTGGAESLTSGSGSGSGGEWETLTDEGRAARAAQA